MNRPFEITRLIKARRHQLESINSFLIGASSPISRTPKAPSPDVHRFESMIAKALDIEMEIKSAEADLDRAVVEVTDAIRSVNNPSYEDVLTARYLEFKDWTTIARDISCSRDWVYHLHRKGMDLIRIR